MKVTLIINPKAGHHRAPKAVGIAQRLCAVPGIELTVVAINGPGHGTELAREAVATGADRVLCAGGDGTLNAVARGLLGTSVPLGIVPEGSGNGYARSLGLPQKPEAALRTALLGTPALMDVCYLNDRPFLGTAGIGFDARVADRFDRTAGRGMWNYMRIIVQEVFGAAPMHITLTVAQERIEADVLMLVFANTREFGNGARIAPAALPDDGLADLKVVRKPGFLGLFRAFLDLYTGNADRSTYIPTVITDRASVQQAGTLAHLDGEPIEIGRHVEFRLEPKRLWVVRG